MSSCFNGLFEVKSRINIHTVEGFEFVTPLHRRRQGLSLDHEITCKSLLQANLGPLLYLDIISVDCAAGLVRS